MAASGCEASFQANSGSSGTAELPLKKRGGLEKGKAVLDESPEKNILELDLNSSETAPENGEKALLEQVPQQADAKPENQQSDPKIHKKGESSNHSQPLSPPHSPSPSPPPAPPKNPIICKFCGAEFNTTQALGGHQNAHKHEREMQRAAKAAQEYGANPYIFQSGGTRAPLLQGPYYGGQQFQYPTYHGLAHRGWQPKPVYSNPGMGYVQGSPSLVQAVGGLAGPSSIRPVSLAYDPGWPRPYAQALGSMIGPNGSTNFNPFAASNLTTFMQVRQNQGGFLKKQCTESTSLSLSLNRNQSSEIHSSVNPNEPTKLDLTLKL